jgi:two-component system chemotaxis response regulator CheY
MRILTRYVLFDLLKVFSLTLTGLTLLIFVVLIGKEAVDKLSVEPVDCVLTDINMPQMNGLDLISYIRSQHREPKLPIIVITTQGEEEARDKGMAQGANAYLTKPISGPKLVSLVKELLD